MNEDCLKLTTYFGERQRSGDRFVAEAMLDLFGEHQIASSILLRGIAGFGPRHHLRTDQTLSMSEDPPVAVIAVDTRNKIDELLDPVLAIKACVLLTLERAGLLTDDIGPVELSASCTKPPSSQSTSAARNASTGCRPTSRCVT